MLVHFAPAWQQVIMQSTLPCKFADAYVISFWVLIKRASANVQQQITVQGLAIHWILPLANLFGPDHHVAFAGNSGCGYIQL